MEPKDIGQVYTLGKKTPWMSVSPQTTFWLKRDLKNWLKGGDILLVAEDKREIVGFILSRLHKPTGSASLEDVLVKDGYRKKGVGGKLLKACLAQLRKMGATYFYALTKTNNERAMNFALKHGFRKGYNFTWLEKT